MGLNENAKKSIARQQLVNPDTLIPAFIDANGNLAIKIASPVESNGAIPVNIPDQHSLALDLNFIKAQAAPTTLISDTAPGDTSISLTSTTGFVDDCVVGLFNPDGFFYFGRQLGAPSGSDINLDTPIDKVFSNSNTTVVCASDNMAVDGSVTTQIFQIGPVGGTTGVEIDITRVMGYIQDATAMDDAKFGGIPALTKGIVLRHNNDIINNIWNIKTNGGFGLMCFDLNYSEKAPAGSFGVRFRNTYAGQAKHGVTIRLEVGDILELLVQDDLTGLEAFNMMAQGHIVTD